MLGDWLEIQGALVGWGACGEGTQGREDEQEARKPGSQRPGRRLALPDVGKFLHLVKDPKRSHLRVTGGYPRHLL